MTYQALVSAIEELKNTEGKTFTQVQLLRDYHHGKLSALDGSGGLQQALLDTMLNWTDTRAEHYDILMSQRGQEQQRIKRLVEGEKDGSVRLLALTVIEMLEQSLKQAGCAMASIGEEKMLAIQSAEQLKDLADRVEQLEQRVLK